MDQTRITKMKGRLGITHDKKDAEIGEHMDAALLEMSRNGIETDDNAMTFMCMELFVKSMLNYENAADRYERAFDGMMKTLPLSGDYHV